MHGMLQSSLNTTITDPILNPNIPDKNSNQPTSIPATSASASASASATGATSTSKTNSKSTPFYGQSNFINIGKITLGKYKFQPWFSNTAYFYPHEGSHDQLGYEYANQVSLEPNSRRRLKITDRECSIENLYVCEYCFKYSQSGTAVVAHQHICPNNVPKPKVGSLAYYDYEKGIVIREVRGYQDPLFCQNLCLFGKLFLDDKSVYYNVDHFNFYIYYAKPDAKENYKPMGFFSKEMIAYDNSNNLACICVFPPYQRRGIGQLLIELLYMLENSPTSNSDRRTGPEVPLSPYGKAAYLKYWSACVVQSLLEYGSVSNGGTELFSKNTDLLKVTLDQLGAANHLRKEDVLFTMEHMGILITENDNVYVSLKALNKWKDKSKKTHDLINYLLQPKYLTKLV